MGHLGPDRKPGALPPFQSQTMTTHTDPPDRHALFPIPAIHEMVHQFYGKVREDALLAPVFDKRIDDWTPHLERMVLFWRSVLRGERVFQAAERGNPMELHRDIEELSHAHFERWLALFADIADEVHGPEAADRVKAAAGSIAMALSRHLSDPARPPRPAPANT